MPGATHPTTGQMTPPRAWCARTEDTDVKMMVASDVAMAVCTMCSSGTPVLTSSMVRKGVRIMPPPMPKSPAKNPVQDPKTISASAISSVIVRPSECGRT